jgi:glucan phosphorylase
VIIGNGDIATALKGNNLDRDDIIFFASGVSNSKETNQECFERERKLLIQQPMNKHLVYFSTLSIYYSDTPYTLHKRLMEKSLKEHFITSCIVRIGNITWGKNQNTLINFIKNKIKNNELFEIKNEYRYLLDEKEFIHWIKMIRVNKTDIMNITGILTYVPDLVEDIKKSLL